jgi:hypothetical protein
MLRRLVSIGLVTIVLLVGLAACGGGDEPPAPTPTTEPAAPPAGPSLSVPGAALDTGSPFGVGEGTVMPGCSDPDDEECPMPLLMDLDGSVTAEGVTLRYPDRYFVAQVGESAPDGAAIALAPSENNVYEQTAHFQVYVADSVQAALAPLGSDAEIVDWSIEALGAGKLGVQRDETQQPPANVTIGAFESGERVIVLRLDTTGKYGWDLWSQLYNNMLNAMTVAD